MPHAATTTTATPLADSTRVPGAVAVVQRARRRLWWASALGRVGYVVAAVLIVASLWVALARADLWPEAWDDATLAAALAVAGVGGLWAAWFRSDVLVLAARLDAVARGGDRLTTALELAAAGRDDAFARVQAADAEVFAATLDIHALLPLPRPAGLAWVVAGAAALAIAASLPLAVLAGDGDVGAAMRGVALDLPPGHLGVVAAAELLGADAIELLQADAALLEDVAAQVEDEKTRVWLGGVRRVLQDVASGAIDRREALERLAELESSRPEKPEPADPAAAAADPSASREAAAEGERDRDRAVQKAITEAVKESLEVAPPSAAKEELKKASESGDLGAMAKVLEKLADKDMSDKELEGWVKAAEKLAKALGVKSVPKEFEEMAERIRRLEQKRDQQGGLSAAEQRRLSNARRALEVLRREHGDVAGAKHQLQTLERGARQAADEMRRQHDARSRLGKAGGGGAQGEAERGRQREGLRRDIGKQLSRAADALRRTSEGQKERQARRIGDSRVRDLREALQRSAEAGGGRKDFERRARRQRGSKAGQMGDGADQQGEAGEQGPQGGDSADGGEPEDEAGDEQGGEGKGDVQGRKAAEREARQRAARAGAEGGKKGKAVPSPGGGRIKLGQGDMPDSAPMGQMPGAKQPGGGGAGEGEGYGEGAGGADRGEAKRIAAARSEKVKGAHGDGPSTKQVFVDAARRGFARTAWRDVYGEYAEVAEEMLDKERLPPGRKALVRRYYELIRPRPAP